MQKHTAPLEDLIRRVGIGDHASFAILYERTSLHLFGVAHRLLGNRQTAEDVLQDAFINIWKNSKNYSSVIDGRQFSAMSWLISVIRNKSLDILRVQNRRKETWMPNNENDPDSEVDFADFSTVSAEQIFDKSMHVLKIGECMKTLDAAPRQCIALAYYHGLSHSEIAEQIGAPVGSVKSWVRRGLMKLKSCLSSAGVVN
jgi:RNA polymerase sigma-70 factor (ECF subfamily)